MFTSIVCAVDFSEVSIRALRSAIEMAGDNRAHLTLVHVTDPLLDAAARAAGTEHTIAEQTQAELKALMQEVARDGLKGSIGVAVVVGDPAQEILRQARDCGAELIVMGTQGLGAAQRLLMGSTAARVIEATTIPVLVVPPQR